jgi:hypothetical protein
MLHSLGAPVTRSGLSGVYMKRLVNEVSEEMKGIIGSSK